MAHAAAEEYFKSNQSVFQVTFDVAALKGGGSAKAASDLTGIGPVKQVLASLLDSLDGGDRASVEEDIMAAAQCRWENGPCGSCSGNRYAYRYDCGNGWVYGCGGCV